ncbi:MAG TPA: NFACT RNA binding domain-containing protein [Vicinamibacteria bacterium]|nr:NFACT RNA binding domain-containing protein [Vicinamibacteria bacterium]
MDASRRAAGLYLVESAATAPIEERDAERLPGRDRHALLLLRKHVAGRAVRSLERPSGRRALLLDFDGPRLALRLSGTPALSLVLEGEVVASVGEGAPAWPLPEPAGETAGAAAPLVALPAPLERCRDRDLADGRRVRFVESDEAEGYVLAADSWVAAGAVYLVARRRGERFDALQRRALQEAAREVRRLVRLAANLERDEAGLPDADTLRRQAEAILASPGAVPQGIADASVPDPYDTARLVQLSLDPRLTATANADRLFARARRIGRARSQVAQRLAETRKEIDSARDGERRASAAENATDLEAQAEPRATRGESAAPRHYLTSRGLSILVGRGARQNHHLTFGVARPEDLWLHARDVPGAHVILRDPEVRAGADDLREAAEVAAFFSDAREEARVDVHVTRRKHVRPAKGGSGRVHVHQSDTMRVVARDPEGRLRRR